MRSQIVIPARLRSTRLPEKLLRRVGGKSILHHTHDAASRAAVTDGVVCAVDDPKLIAEVESFGGRALLTSVACASGTDRVAEAAAATTGVDLFVNVQGDEPEIEPAVIEAVLAQLAANPDAAIATAVTPIRDPRRLEDPACVKAVVGAGGRALYFSRAPVPHLRDGDLDGAVHETPPRFFQHVGIYAYRRDFLVWFAAAPPSTLEQTEKLEQLRALEAGKSIVVVEVASAPLGIDTAADLQAFESRFSG